MAIDFPRTYLGPLHDFGAQLLDRRRPKSDDRPLARELLAGFHDICMRNGLDRVLADIAAAHPPLEIDDAVGLAEHPALSAALVERLATVDLDGGGPRKLRPGLLADAVLAALGVTVVDEPDRTIALGADVRAAALAAIAAVIDPELATPQIRDAIIEAARPRCAEHGAAFGRIAAQLDDRGMKLVKQPKVPLHIVQAVQQVIAEVTDAIVERLARAAIDRVQPVFAAANPDAAARIDQPVTLRLTPREIALRRALDPRITKSPNPVAQALLAGLADAARITWRAADKPVRPYAASQTFAIGDIVEHPKFLRGVVVSTRDQRVDIEFADATRTLVHVGVGK